VCLLQFIQTKEVTTGDTAHLSSSTTSTAPRTASASTSSTATASASTTSTATATPKRARKGGEQSCFDVVSKYYSSKLSAVASSEKPTPTDEDSFCEMLAAEMKKIYTGTVKRAPKRKLFDAVMAAQEEGEQIFECVILHQNQAQDTADTAAQQPTTSAEFADILDLELDCSSST